MSQTLVITSGKGGVGKTSASVNIAIELARRKYRTCLFDADLGLANVNILLGIQPEFTLDDCIFGDKDLDQIVQQTKFGVDVIPGSSGVEAMANLTKEHLSKLISSFGGMGEYDYLLIDTSAGIAHGVLAFCLASRETIIVITSEATSLTDGYALLKVMALNHYSGTVKILVNKSHNIPAAKETYLRFKEVVNKHLKIKIAPAGIILNDPNVEASVSRQEPILSLYPNSRASQCIQALVDNLLKNRSVQEDDLNDFWQRYFDFRRSDLPKDIKLLTKRPKKSFQLVNPETLPPVQTIKPQQTSENGRTAKPTQDSPAESFFATGKIIFELSTLPGPTPLLATGFDLHCQGKLSPEILLDLVTCDPVLMVKSLKMCMTRDGRADVSPEDRVTCRQQLTEQISDEALSNLFVSSAIQRAFEPLSPEIDGLVTSFWLHSYTCGALAEAIARTIHYPFPEEAFIAGLIHDIGRLALCTHHPTIYEQNSSVFNDDVASCLNEQHLFKMSHGEIGATALKSWHFDDFLVDAVRFHTEPFERIQTGFNLVKIIYLACRIHSLDAHNEESDLLAKRLLGLSTEQLQTLIKEAKKRRDRLARRFNINCPEGQQEPVSEALQSRFRQQARDYSILRTVLPRTIADRVNSRDTHGAGDARGLGDENLSKILSSVFQAFEILFDIRPALYLSPSDQPSLLKAIEPGAKFTQEKLADIAFSLSWEKSLVVKSFLLGELKTAMTGESSGILPLADCQLLRSLASQGFVSVPLVSQQRTWGLIIFGISKTELPRIVSLQDRLIQFGRQAAELLYGFSRG